MWLRSTRIITPDGVRAGTIGIREGRISDVRLDDARSGGPGILEHAGDGLDLDDHWIAPGFIDTHVHGGGGAQCNSADPDEILAVARFHAAHGTTALLATTVAAPVADLKSALGAISAAARASGARGVTDGETTADAAPASAAVLGAHLEGPFISPSHPGAMDPGHFLAPTREVWERLLTGVRGPLMLMTTIAPELPGALELTAALAGAGVVVSVGHSGASYEQSRDAARAGATAVTHLFNGMRPLHHRDPGIVGAALDLPELSCELICDGHHVATPVVRLAARAKGLDGLRLVTDAIEAAGMPDGDYRLGTGPVRVRAGRATVPGTERLAGSTLTMQEVVRNAMRMLEIPFEAAVSLAATNPARLLGIADRKGSVAPGCDADLIVLDDDLGVERTMVGGSWVP